VVDKQKRVQKQAIMYGGLGVLLLAGVLIAMWAMPNGAPVKPVDVKPQAFYTVIDANTAPADVQDAAAKLATSRVGYPIVKADKTYLVISTGNLTDQIAYDRAEGQPDLISATFLDLHFKADAAGQSLQIGTVPLTGTDTEYQFNVGESYASIPTLHNRHNLPLIPLDAARRFSMVSPAEGAMVGSSGNLHLEGYAQVFEASFMVTITTAKGRVIGQQAVMSAAGAPSWGSFVADIPYDTSGLTETGFVILDEGMTGAKITIPVRFKPASQLG
jgi:hypothetical protein